MQTEISGIAAALAQLAGLSADADHVATTAVATWLNIDAALAPIIGNAGVAALYRRSLYLNRNKYPALAAAYESSTSRDDYAGLHAALSQRTSAEAVVSSSALLQTFNDLLTRLIGASLAERLLRSIGNTFTSGDAAQDISP